MEHKYSICLKFSVLSIHLLHKFQKLNKTMQPQEYMYASVQNHRTATATLGGNADKELIIKIKYFCHSWTR